MFNQKMFEIHRPTVTSGNKKEMTDTGRKVVVKLEPIDIEFAQLAGLAFGKSYKGFIMAHKTDIAEKDRLVSGTKKYEVKGVQVYEHPPKHIEVMLEEVIN